MSDSSAAPRRQPPATAGHVAPAAGAAAEGDTAGEGSQGAGQRLRWRLLVAAVAVLAVAWIAVAALLFFRHSDAIATDVRQNTNLARALEEQTVRVLATTDNALRRLRDALAGAEGGEQPEYARFASETGLSPNILVQLAYVDHTGHFVASNLDPDGRKTGPVDLSAREHIRVHLNPGTLPEGQRLASRDDLYIGQPVLGKVSQKWTIQLSRRIADAQGTTIGVVVASLDPSYFEDVFRRVVLGQLGGVTLVGADLGIRARVVGGASAGMGTRLPPNGVFQRVAQGDEGHFLAPSPLDSVDRIVAYRRVSGYPLYLLVTTSVDEALAEWRATRNVTLLLTALLSIAFAFAATSFIISLRRMDAAHAALRRSEAEANAANQAKTEFLAAVSHELRTPLTSIRGFAELMEARLDRPETREQAALIRKSAEHLNALLSEILDLARVDAGAMPLNVEAVDIRPLVQGTADFFALTAANKGLALGVTIAPDVPRTLECDGLRLKQILNNLLSNALKFTSSGSVGISVERVAQGIAFHVDDTGPGIDPDLHEVIFERFRQANDRISYEHGGTGLGLALSRGLATLMRGTLTLRSQPGAGARFTLTLPLA